MLKKVLARQSAPVFHSISGDTLVLYDQLPQVGVPHYSRVYLRELIAKGGFPKPVQLSVRRIAWKLSDLEAWKSSRPIKSVTEHVAAER